MTLPIIIAQISDFHVKPDGELVQGHVDAAAATACAIAALNAFRPRPDLVVISGDLVDEPLANAYERVKRLLALLELPFVVLPGNRDSRQCIRTTFPHVPAGSDSDPINQAVVLKDLDLLLLDSTVPGQSHGELDSRTLRWLETQLSHSSERPALLFLHHPPFVSGIKPLETKGLENASCLEEIVAQHPRVQLVAAGHEHRATVSSFAGRLSTICPSVSFAVDLDIARETHHAFVQEQTDLNFGGLARQRRLAFILEPPGFHLHLWWPEAQHRRSFGRIVTHLVPIGAFGSPQPFA